MYIEDPIAVGVDEFFSYDGEESGHDHQIHIIIFQDIQEGCKRILEELK